MCSTGMKMNEKQVDLVEIHHGGGYGSEFEYDSDIEKQRAHREDLAKPGEPEKSKLPSKLEVTSEYNKEEGRTHRFHILSLDAYTRHKKFINDYLFYYGGEKAEFKRDASRDKRDIDVIREHHRFLWTDDDKSSDTWERCLAKKYHDKLFKEYCITDLSRYKENKVALRWRIEKEVIDGKGQFVCGDKRCRETEGMRTWEVNFGYMEHGEKKNALVKLRLCPDCSYKLNYHHRKKEVTRKRRAQQDEEPTDKRTKKSKHDHGEVGDAATASASPESEAVPPPTQPGGEDTATPEGEGEASAWTGPVKVTEEKSREEEFENYFEDMFL